MHPMDRGKGSFADQSQKTSPYRECKFVFLPVATSPTLQVSRRKRKREWGSGEGKWIIYIV